MRLSFSLAIVTRPCVIRDTARITICSPLVQHTSTQTRSVSLPAPLSLDIHDLTCPFPFSDPSCSSRARLKDVASSLAIASRLPAHLRNLSSSLAPAPRVVFVPSPASCLVVSLRRHSSNASDAQVLALRGLGSSSSLVALFSDWGFYA